MYENVVFGEETFLKRNIIERMQNMGENKYLKEFTPEELMTFIGYIAKQKDGEIETSPVYVLYSSNIVIYHSFLMIYKFTTFRWDIQFFRYFLSVSFFRKSSFKTK